MTTPHPALDFRVFRCSTGALLIVPIELELPPHVGRTRELLGRACLRVSALSNAALNQLGMLGYAEVDVTDQAFVLAALSVSIEAAESRAAEVEATGSCTALE